MISAAVPRESGRGSLPDASPAHLTPSFLPAYCPLATPHLTSVDVGYYPSPPYSPCGSQQVSEAIASAYPTGYRTCITFSNPVCAPTEKRRLEDERSCVAIQNGRALQVFGPSQLGIFPHYGLLRSRTPSPVYSTTVLEMTPPLIADRHLQGRWYSSPTVATCPVKLLSAGRTGSGQQTHPSIH